MPLTSGDTTVDGLVVHVDLGADGERGSDRVRWSVSNPGAADVALDAVRLVVDAGPAGSYPRMFCNGYQSWSETSTRFLGIDEDPSRHPRTFRFFRTIHHADAGRAPARELRSEMVTAIASGTPTTTRVVGFVGGSTHEGTMRASLADDRVELVCEAWLGGAVLRAGTTRALHDVVALSDDDDVLVLLDRWAHLVRDHERARVDAPYQVGWCSWYHYFHDISETALRSNLARSDDWPFAVFQLDDGFQPAIGDWLDTNDKFASDLPTIADAIRTAGRTPGLWIAPFLAAPDSEIARTRPELFAREVERDEPLTAMVHDVWGGAMWGLDTTDPAALAHLESVAATLREMGYPYLKLDFTFSPTFDGRYSDPTRTPAERVRAGYEAIRRGAGDDAFILACGCPLGSVVGVVDAMRIGPDVSPSWEVAAHDVAWPGYERVAPSTRAAWNSTLLRAFLHRRLWLNDPDCLMLRHAETAMTTDQIEAWSAAVALSGGLALVSDDLALLDHDDHARLDDVITIGKAADAAAQHGLPPRCEDQLQPGGPRVLSAAGRRLTADPADPHPVIEKF